MTIKGLSYTLQIMKVIQRLKPKQKGAYQKKLKKVNLDVKICAIPYTSWYSLAIKFGDHLFLKDGTLDSLLYDSRDFFDKHNLNGFKSKKDILKNATLVQLQGESTDENIQKALGIILDNPILKIKNTNAKNK